MNQCCSQNNMTLETDSSVIYYLNFQMISITDFQGYAMWRREKNKNQNHIIFLVIHQRNKDILEHKYNQDDKSIKIQCFSNGNELSAKETDCTLQRMHRELKSGVDLWKKAYLHYH